MVFDCSSCQEGFRSIWHVDIPQRIYLQLWSSILEQIRNYRAVGSKHPPLFLSSNLRLKKTRSRPIFREGETDTGRCNQKKSLMKIFIWYQMVPEYCSLLSQVTNLLPFEFMKQYRNDNHNKKIYYV